jgi:hypothetical protein
MPYDPSKQTYFKLRVTEYKDWIYLMGLSFNAFEKYTIVQDPICSNWPVVAIFTKKEVEEGKANEYLNSWPEKGIARDVSCWYIMKQLEQCCLDTF